MNFEHPTYLIEEEKLIKNCETIRDIANEAGVEFILALKGFALWKIFPLIKPYIAGVSVSSVNESQLAKDYFDLPLHAYCPVYTDSSFKQINSQASHLTFNSLSQYQRFAKENSAVSYGLRINPELSQVETELYNPCRKGSRLGIKRELIGKTLPKGIEGLHAHALCESSAEESVALLDAIELHFGDLLPQLKWLNLGGGHLVTRKGYDRKLFIEGMKAFKLKYPNLNIILEPSAAFVWQTGCLIAQVEDIVENDAVKTAMLNVSFTAHMPDCLEMPYKPTIKGGGEGEAFPYNYALGGCSCLAGDFIADFGFKEPLKVGDSIIFEDMIHYTTVKTTLFNGVQHPDIAILKADKSIEVLKHFDFDDYRTRMC